MKNIVTFIGTFGAGVLVAYLAIRLPEEDLRFTLSEPAAFGDVIYQNLSVENQGWNPAENVALFFPSRQITDANMKSSSALVTSSVPVGAVAYLPRLRRQETVVIALSYSGHMLSPSDISIKSDRSIAQFLAPTAGWRFQWGSFWIGGAAFFVFVMVLSGGIPSFIKAKQVSQVNACLNNLRLIDSAKEQVALSLGLEDGGDVSVADLKEYLKDHKLPVCASGGNYVLNSVGDEPVCSKHGRLSERS